MGDVTITYKVCSLCGGIIPADAPQVNNLAGRVTTTRIVPVQTGVDANGEPVVEQVQRFGSEDFHGLDFCSTAHLTTFIGSLEDIPTPTTPLLEQSVELAAVATARDVTGTILQEAS